MGGPNKSLKPKIIRDAVHGYIEIPGAFVKEIIDTPIFQRLLRIQQTNLSVLYPSATHTRFEHSLGVFYLGGLLFDTLCKNTTNFDVCGISKDDFIQKYRTTFLLACLLHDVGHAPLSHTGEQFFEEDDMIAKLKGLGVDIDMKKGRKPARHEIMSCAVALHVFGDFLSSNEIDKELFCRIIMGLEYTREAEDKPIRNILTQVLNSSFDVDKMDYIMRDAASAGVTSLMLDVHRIASSLAILDCAGEPRLAFLKHGFSVINSVIDNRNYLYYWLYGHHKVQYQQYLLKSYIRELVKKEKEIKKLFSFEGIIGEIELHLPFSHSSLCQVDDYDVLEIMKVARKLDSDFSQYYSQIFERKHYHPLWKTKIEFDQQCNSNVRLLEKLPTIMTLGDNPSSGLETEICDYLKRKGVDLEPSRFCVFNREFKISFPTFEEKIYCYVQTAQPQFKRYSELFNVEGAIPISQITQNMFYVFIDEEKWSLGQSIIDALCSLA
jgi:HD superfamily phosphohydrolase